MAETGFGAAPVPSLNTAIQRVLDLLYAGIPLPEKPITLKHVAKADRNAEIRARYAAGEILEELAAEYGVSHQRIHQIVHFHQRWAIFISLSHPLLLKPWLDLLFAGLEEAQS